MRENEVLAEITKEAEWLARQIPFEAEWREGCSWTLRQLDSWLREYSRALLSLPSAFLGFSGFTLALFDARGQTLHDKLCRCVVRID